MLNTRRLPPLIAVLFGLAASVDATALGFGRAPQTAVLGQPLDFAVPLRLEAGESLAAECLSAEVMVGDNRVAPYLVRAQVESASSELATVRVTTTPAVDEPVVTVTVTAGCTARVSRRFLLLADPPATMPVASPPVVLAELRTAAAPNGAGSDLFALPANPAAAVALTSPSTAPSTPQPAAAATAAPTAAATAAGAGPGRRTGPGLAASATGPRGDGAASRPLRKPAATAPSAERKPPPKAVAAPGPRLTLDVAEPVASTPALLAAAVIEEAITAVAQAASAAQASALAASAAAQRIGALEQEVQTLRAQAQAGRDEAAAWRAQAAAARSGQAGSKLLWVAVLVLAALCGWLAWRMRVLRQADQRSWLRAAAAPPNAKVPAASAASSMPPVTSPIPLVNSELELPSLPRPAWPAPVPVPPRAAPVLPVAVPAPAPKPVVVAGPGVAAAGADVEATAVLPVGERMGALAPNLRPDDGAARDVSIEELLDLEQQAEFFIALDQDDAAIDLLVEHLRSTGGGSPLPYLKLLEIYRRRNEPQAYERTRARFNDRFNAYAPDWDSDLLAGRSLEEYAGIVPRLQQAWPRPLDAMAELEALLFRKSRGELFELPAYREVLFLYALARDLLEREPSEPSDVDILLPLDGSDAASAFPPLAANPAEYAAGGRPTEPVDLDLSVPTGNDSVFGELPASARPR